MVYSASPMLMNDWLLCFYFFTINDPGVKKKRKMKACACACEK